MFLFFFKNVTFLSVVVGCVILVSSFVIEGGVEGETEEQLFEFTNTQQQASIQNTVGVDDDASTHLRSYSNNNSNSDSNTSTKRKPPLKIFILVGQSNMEGHGYIATKVRQSQSPSPSQRDTKENEEAQHPPPSVYRNGTLAWMVDTYPEKYGKLQPQPNSWHARHDVFITYNKQTVGQVRPEWNHYGPLLPGYGMGHTNQDEMGPELGFGWTIGDAVLKLKRQEEDDQEQEEEENEDSLLSSSGSSPNILLLKVAWGGRSLAVDYRPPSSSSSSTNPILPDDDDNNNTNNVQEISTQILRRSLRRPESTTGLYYEAMLANIYKTIANLSTLVPNYTKDQRGYELSGFVWHQGWNDGCNETMVAEYESNLANLIRDVRIDLDVPDLPVVIGVSGMNGWTPEETNNARTKIIAAQFAVSDPRNYPEFKGTVSSVETRNYFRTSTQSPGTQIYHWNNNCESYWLIGEAMGKAMIELLSPNGDDNTEGEDTNDHIHHDDDHYKSQ